MEQYLLWEKFKKTGKIEDYLLYTKRKNEWYHFEQKKVR